MDTTQNLELPYILAAQAQKHVTHNEALLVLDHVVQLAADDRDLASPPPAPAEGQRFIVAAGATGAWSGHSGHIAAWQDGGWTFYDPQEGWLCFVRDEDRLLVWTGAEWLDPAPLITALQNLSLLGVGTTADAQNPFSAKLNNALWTAKAVAEGGDGDLRYKMNKESAAKTLSLLMQTGFSGRAEIGLTGDDKLHVKVSADGATWKEAMVVDPATGYVGVGGVDAPEGPLHILRGAASPVHERIDDAASAATWEGRKARGTPGAKTTVLEGDIIQAFYGRAWDGAAYVACCNLRWAVDGPPSAGAVPTRIEFWTFTPAVGQTEKMRVTKDGNVGIGTTAPTCRLDVAGPARVAQYAKAALPAASTCGAGAIVYVTDEIGGAVIAFSDGASWRRVTDRAVVG